jgi:hypothetical protein
VGAIDGELIAGRRRQDRLVAAAFSAPLLSAEVHGELAYFGLPTALPQGGKRAFKAVLGASYHWDLVSGLLVLGEYHYSGFGVDQVDRAARLLEQETYGERFVLGDAQILGRHAGALQISWGLGRVAPFTGGWIFSPQDGSGVGTLALSWYFSDSVTLAATGYWPHGKTPRRGQLRSEYGGTPKSGLVQISFYY